MQEGAGDLHAAATEGVVLGAGPAGLVAAYLLGWPVFGEVPGISEVARLAPTYLWSTEKVRALLRRLDFETGTRRITYGVLDREGVRARPTEIDREIYYRRSRNISRFDPVEVPPSVMSDATFGSFEACLVSMEALCGRILERVRFLRSKILDVRKWGDADLNAFQIDLAGGPLLTTSRICNTLPAPVWYRLRGQDREFSAGTKSFVVGCGTVYPGVREMQRAGMSYAYVVDGSLPFDRVTFREGVGVVFEFNGEDLSVPMEFAHAHGGKVALSGRLQIGRPWPEERTLDYEEPGVSHVGRMARWDHAVRIHDVVEELLR